MKHEFCVNIFEKWPKIKFHKNLSSGSRVVPSEQTEGGTGRWTDITKLIVGFSQFCESI